VVLKIKAISHKCSKRIFLGEPVDNEAFYASARKLAGARKQLAELLGTSLKAYLEQAGENSQTEKKGLKQDYPSL
jgi:hypothetical protein